MNKKYYIAKNIDAATRRISTFTSWERSTHLTFINKKDDEVVIVVTGLDRLRGIIAESVYVDSSWNSIGKDIKDYVKAKSIYLNFIDKILMTREHPNGWKLEELLKVLVSEIRHKNNRIEGSDCHLVDMIQRNNTDIMNYLLEATHIQERTMSELDAMEPNHGPENPRL